MLGLGDIVIPGIFVALVLRYDVRHARQTSFFNRCAPAVCAESVEMSGGAIEVL